MPIELILLEFEGVDKLLFLPVKLLPQILYLHIQLLFPLLGIFLFFLQILSEFLNPPVILLMDLFLLSLHIILHKEFCFELFPEHLPLHRAVLTGQPVLFGCKLPQFSVQPLDHLLILLPLVECVFRVLPIIEFHSKLMYRLLKLPLGVEHSLDDAHFGCQVLFQTLLLTLKLKLLVSRLTLTQVACRRG